MNIIEAMDDAALFGPWFAGESWLAWRVALAVTYGLPIGEDGAALFRQCTGRKITPTAQGREVWFIVGRRGGKTRIAALVAVYVACFRDYRAHLAPGEMATVALIAADRRQARVLMRYIVGFLDAVPMLTQRVASRTKESITLTNRVVIEVHTANFRAVRGYTLVAVIADEVAFWRNEDSANPDTEILNGLRPGMATIPGALLLCISSPFSRRGALWDAYRKHFAQDGDPVLVWQADTASMNPTVDPQVVAEAYEQDPDAAAAEFGAEFRRDIEAFVSREAVEAAVIPGRLELPPISDVNYRAAVDPSGGSADSMTLAIAHRATDGRVQLDAVRERKPPFSPADVVSEFSELMRAYRISRVVGDRYAGEWPREQFRTHGIVYDVADKSKSDYYRDALPLLNSGQVELLDNNRLVAQLVALERRTARSGKDSIDHGPGGHDDVANAVAVALIEVKKRKPLYAC